MAAACFHRGQGPDAALTVDDSDEAFPPSLEQYARPYDPKIRERSRLCRKSERLSGLPVDSDGPSMAQKCGSAMQVRSRPSKRSKDAADRTISAPRAFDGVKFGWRTPGWLPPHDPTYTTCRAPAFGQPRDGHEGAVRRSKRPSARSSSPGRAGRQPPVPSPDVKRITRRRPQRAFGQPSDRPRRGPMSRCRHGFPEVLGEPDLLAQGAGVIACSIDARSTGSP